MKAVVLKEPGAIEDEPLEVEDVEKPEVKRGQIRLKVDYCGVCRTDLHIVEGELPPVKLPVIVGHQVIGRVEATGEGVEGFEPGDAVGLPWLGWTCGRCRFCRMGLENLCEEIKFFGYSLDGGYAEFVVADANFAYRLPEGIYGANAAPLLCGGVIGYRAYRLSEVQSGERLGLFGFGASAHLVLQIAIHHGCEVFVFTRSEHHRQLARELGAAWVGGATDDPKAELDAAIIFAPAGWLVVEALKKLRKGGCVAHAGVYSSPIPEFDYDLLYGERRVRSVANSTRQDVRELLKLAAEIPLKPTVELFDLTEANRVLKLLKDSRLKASAVLNISGE